MTSADDHARAVQGDLDKLKENGLGEYTARPDDGVTPVAIAIYDKDENRIGGGHRDNLHVAIKTAMATRKSLEQSLKDAGCL